MMKFLKPVPINDTNLVSSTRPENDYPKWASATSYVQGARVINTTTHRVYESARAANVGHDPATDDGSNWVDVGPTNRWAMFDESIGTLTAQTAPLTVVLKPGFIGALALLDVAGARVDVSMSDGVTTVYAKSFNIGDSTVIIDWWDYYYAPIVMQSQLIVSDLPPYDTATLTVSVSAIGAAQCGTLAVGSMVELGDLRSGTRVGITDYSRKETSDFGVTSLVERAYARRYDADIVVNNIRLDYVAVQLAAIRATPVIWIASERYASLIVYGWARDWGINLSSFLVSETSLTIEGLI